MTTPTFVVSAGPGRCSTPMLPDMLRKHPKLLSRSEFFMSVTDGMRTPKAFSDAFTGEAIDGRRFWSIIAAVNPHFNFALSHQPPNYLGRGQL